MNKNYFLIGITLIAVIAVYFVFFNETQETFSFNSGLTEINSLWEKQGLKTEYLISPLKVYAAEKTKLIELKSDLTDFKESLKEKENSEDKEKLDLLLETQIHLINNALLQKENFVSIDFFESNNYNFDVLCSYSNKVQDLQENLVLQKNSAESFNEKVLAFSEAYPDEAEKSGLSVLSLEVSSEQKLSDLESMVLTLKGVC